MKIKLGKYSLIIFFRSNTYNSKMDKDRLRKYQNKRRRLHLCKICGTPVKDINPKTKRPYAKCKPHRDRENYLKRQKLINL